MEKILYDAICGIIMTIVHVYMWVNVLDKQLEFRKFSTYILLLLLPCIITLNYLFINDYFKIALITFAFMVFCKFLFNVSLSKAIITPIVSQIFISISEFIFALVFLTIINVNDYEIFNTYVGTLLPNFFIALTAFILTKFGLVKRFYNWLLKITEKVRKYELFIFVTILIITINLIQVNIYYKVELRSLILVNIVIMLIYAIIIFKLANVENNYLIVASKYNVSKSSLKEFEAIVSRYRIDNHENKSQLKRLRNKIDKENKEAIEYIDMILDTRIKNNEKILNKTKIIPDSDLKVLIDSKIMTMEEKNIKNRLHVDKEVKTIDLIEMDPLLMEDICKIVGVYLDNAIEAVETLDKKEIQLDLYKLDDFLCISVVNNYEGEIELDKLYDVGYTTKDNGHGYGLPLVAEIVDNNKNLSKETHVNEEIFRQVLKIKM